MDPDPLDSSEPQATETRPSLFAERFERLVGYVGGHSDPPDPGQVLAMQMVLHIPKAEPPDRTDLLNAAASAVAQLCLDERSGGDGPWAGPMDAWCDARIRKIARRARGAHWEAAQDVPGVTASCGSAMARAIVPGPVGETDKRIARLQIGGTEISGDTAINPSAAGPVLWVNPTLEMTVGKLAAQVGARLDAGRQADEPRPSGPMVFCRLSGVGPGRLDPRLGSAPGRRCRRNSCRGS